MAGLELLRHEEVAEALRLLTGADAPTNRGTALRSLRQLLGTPGTVRAVLDRAPAGARAAFVRLAGDGPAAVEDLLGRGWWGHGTLPPPLDWLQRRALVVVGDEGLVHPVPEARDGFLELTLDLAAAAPAAGGDLAAPTGALQVEEVACVVVATTPSALDRAVTVPGAQLRLVAPTVAVSTRTARAVRAALAGAGIDLGDQAVVAADPRAPALPGTAEEAVGPKALRALLERAVTEQRQVRLQYFASSRGGAPTDRVVDPWVFRDDLLRGWCHLRSDERTFAVDRIGRARLLPSAVEVRADRG